MIAHAEYPMYTVLLLKFKIKYSFKRIIARHVRSLHFLMTIKSNELRSFNLASYSFQRKIVDEISYPSTKITTTTRCKIFKPGKWLSYLEK